MGGGGGRGAAAAACKQGLCCGQVLGGKEQVII